MSHPSRHAVLSRPARRLLSAAAVALLPSLVPLGASAQDPRSLQLAQVLYDQAVKEMDTKDFAAACPKLEEAARLVPEAVGARLTLAECYEGADKLASAQTMYEVAEAAAARQNQAERRKLARERADGLKPKLATLTITVPEAVGARDGLEIQRDGVPVGKILWGMSVPVDRGDHVIRATSGDGGTWEKKIRISENGAHETVVVGNPEGAPATTAPAITAPPGPTATAHLDTSSAPSRIEPSSVRRPAGIALASAGGAGIVAALALGAVALSTKDQSNADGHCDAAGHCDATGTDLRNASLTSGDWATALFVGGAVALAGGVVLVATAPAAAPASRPARAEAARVELRATPSGLQLRGSF